MSKKKSNNIFLKDYKYENHVLLVLAIISIILGLLVLLDILNFDESQLKNEKLIGTILLVFGVISLIYSIFKIIKKNQFDKLPKPKIYEMIKDAYDSGEEIIIKNLFLENGYHLHTDDAIGIEKLDKEYWLLVHNDKAGCFIKIDLNKLSLELCLNDSEEENVKDEFYDFDEDLFYKEYEISESTDFNSLINMINMFYDEQLDMLLERYNQFKN